MGRALACLRWTSQTTRGDGASMERWSTRACWRAVRREAAGSKWVTVRGSLGLASLGQGRLSHISAARMGASGCRQQKHAGDAPGVPNRRGDEDVDTRGFRGGTLGHKRTLQRDTTGSLLLALRSDGHEQLAATGPSTP